MSDNYNWFLEEQKSRQGLLTPEQEFARTQASAEKAIVENEEGAEQAQDYLKVQDILDNFKKQNPYASYSEFAEFVRSNLVLRQAFKKPDKLLESFGQVLPDEDAINNAYQERYYKEDLYNTLRQDSAEEGTIWNQVVKGIKGFESVIRTTASPYMYDEEILEGKRSLAQNPVKDKIGGIDRKINAATRLQSDLYSLREELANTPIDYGNRESILKYQNLMDKISNKEKQLQSLNLTPEEQAVYNSPEAKDYWETLNKVSQLEAAKDEFNNSTLLSKINPGILAENKTLNGLKKELDSQELERKAYILGDENFTYTDRFIQATKNAWNNTTMGEVIGSILPYVLTGELAAPLRLATYGTTAYGRYMDNLIAQYTNNPIESEEKLRALMGGIASTVADFYGSKMFLDTPQKQIVERLWNQTLTKPAIEAADLAKKRLKALGLPADSPMFREAYAQAYAELAPKVQAELLAKTLQSENSQIRALGRKMLELVAPESGKVRAALGTTAAIPKALMRGEELASTVGLGVRAHARASGGLALENALSNMATQYGENTNVNSLQDIDAGKVIESAAEGAVSGGLFHAPSIGMHAAGRAISSKMKGLNQYGGVSNSKLERLLRANDTDGTKDDTLNTVSKASEANNKILDKELGDYYTQYFKNPAFKGIEFIKGEDGKVDLGKTAEDKNIPPETMTALTQAITAYNNKVDTIQGIQKTNQNAIDKISQYREDQQVQNWSDKMGTLGDIKALATDAEVMTKFNTMTDKAQDRVLDNLLKPKDSTVTETEEYKKQKDQFKGIFKNALNGQDVSTTASKITGVSTDTAQSAIDKATSIGMPPKLLEGMTTEQVEAFNKLDINEPSNNNYSKFEGTLYNFIDKDFISTKQKQQLINAKQSNSLNDKIKAITSNAVAKAEFEEAVKSELANTDQNLKNYVTNAIKNNTIPSGVDEFINEARTSNVATTVTDEAIKQVYDKLANPDALVDSYIADWNSTRDAKEYDSEEAADKDIKSKGAEPFVSKGARKYGNKVTVRTKNDSDNFKVFTNIAKAIKLLSDSITNGDSKESIQDSIDKAVLGIELFTSSDEYKTVLKVTTGKQRQALEQLQDFRAKYSNKSNSLVLNNLQKGIGLIKAARDTYALHKDKTLKKAGIEESYFHGYNRASRDVARAFAQRQAQEEAERNFKQKATKGIFDKELRNFRDISDSGKASKTYQEFLFSGLYFKDGNNITTLSDKGAELSEALSNVITKQDYTALNNLHLHITQGTYEDLSHFVTALSIYSSEKGGNELAEYRTIASAIRTISALAASGYITIDTDNHTTSFSDNMNTTFNAPNSIGVATSITTQLLALANSANKLQSDINNEEYVADLVYSATTGIRHNILSEPVVRHLARQSEALLDDLWGSPTSDNVTMGWQATATNLQRILSNAGSSKSETKSVLFNVYTKAMESGNTLVVDVLKDFTSGVVDYNSLKQRLNNLAGKNRLKFILGCLDSALFCKYAGLLPVRDTTRDAVNNSSANAYNLMVQDNISWTHERDQIDHNINNITPMEGIRTFATNLLGTSPTDADITTMTQAIYVALHKYGHINQITSGNMVERTILSLANIERIRTPEGYAQGKHFGTDLNKVVTRWVTGSGFILPSNSAKLLAEFNNYLNNLNATAGTPEARISALFKVQANYINSHLGTSVFNYYLHQVQTALNGTGTNAPYSNTNIASNALKEHLARLTQAYKLKDTRSRFFDDYNADAISKVKEANNISKENLSDILQYGFIPKILGLRNSNSNTLGSTEDLWVHIRGTSSEQMPLELNQAKECIDYALGHPAQPLQDGLNVSDLSNLFIALFGDSNKEGLVQRLKVPLSYRTTATATNGVLTGNFNGKFSVEHNPVYNIADAQKRHNFQRCSYGTAHGMAEVLGSVGNEAIAQPMRDAVDWLLSVIPSNYASNILKDYFQTLGGDLSSRMFETVVGVAFASLKDITGKENSQDFIDKLEHPALRTWFTQNNDVVDATALNIELGNSILKSLGIKVPPVEASMMGGALGGLAIAALTHSKLIDVNYVGVNDKGIVQVVSNTDFGKNKAGKRCVIKVTEQAKTLKGLIDNSTYNYALQGNTASTTRNILQDAYTPDRLNTDAPQTLDEMVAECTRLQDEYTNNQNVASLSNTNDYSITFNQSGNPTTAQYRITKNYTADIIKIDIDGELANALQLQHTNTNSAPYTNGSVATFYMSRSMYTKKDGTELTPDRILKVLVETWTPRKLDLDAFRRDFGSILDMSTNQGNPTIRMSLDDVVQWLNVPNIADIPTNFQEPMKFIRGFINYHPESVPLTGDALSRYNAKALAEAKKLWNNINYFCTNISKFREANNKPVDVFFVEDNTKNNRVYDEAQYMNFREYKPLRNYFMIKSDSATNSSFSNSGITINVTDKNRHLVEATILANLGFKHDKMTIANVNDAYLSLSTDTAFKALLGDINKLSNTTTFYSDVSTLVDTYNKDTKATYSYRGKSNKKMEISLNAETFYGIVELAKILQSNNQGIIGNINGFTLRVEQDGLTNGAALKILGSEAFMADLNIMAATGLYISDTNKPDGLNTNTVDGGGFFGAVETNILDLYEIGGKESKELMLENIIDNIDFNDKADNTNDFKDFLNETFVGNSTESLGKVLSRNFMKPPFTAENYGSGLEALHLKLSQILSNRVSAYIYSAITGSKVAFSDGVLDIDNLNGMEGFKKWLDSAVNANGEQPIVFTNANGTAIKIDKEGFIVGSNRTENVFTNGVIGKLQNFTFNLEHEGNNAINSQYKSLFSRNIYDGIDVVKKQSSTISNILNDAANTTATTVSRILYNELSKQGLTLESGVSVERIDAVLDNVVHSVNTALSIGTNGTKLNMVDVGKGDRLKNIIMDMLVKTSDGTFVYKPRMLDPIPQSIGSALPPMSTHTMDGNIIQNITLRLITDKGIHFLGIHDATLTTPDVTADVGVAINGQAFDEIFKGTISTINSAIENMEQQLALCNRLGLPTTEVYSTLSDLKNYRDTYRNTVGLQMQRLKTLITSGKTAYLNQYQLFNSGKKITEDDINKVLDALGTSTNPIITDLAIQSLNKELVGLSKKTREAIFEVSRVDNSNKLKADIVGTITDIDTLEHVLLSKANNNSDDINIINKAIAKYRKQTISDTLFSNLYSKTATYSSTTTLPIATTGTSDAVSFGINKVLEADLSKGSIYDSRDSNHTQSLIENVERGLSSAKHLMRFIPNGVIKTLLTIQAGVTEGSRIDSDFLNMFGSSDIFNGVDFTNVKFEIPKDGNIDMPIGSLNFSDLKNYLKGERNRLTWENKTVAETNTSPSAWYNSVFMKQVANTYRGKKTTIVLTMRNKETDILLFNAIKQLQKDPVNGKDYAGINIAIVPMVLNKTINNYDTSRINRNVLAYKVIGDTIKDNNKTSSTKQQVNFNITLAPNSSKDAKLLSYIMDVPFDKAFISDDTRAGKEYAYLDPTKQKDKITYTNMSMKDTLRLSGVVSKYSINRVNESGTSYGATVNKELIYNDDLNLMDLRTTPLSESELLSVDTNILETITGKSIKDLSVKDLSNELHAVNINDLIHNSTQRVGNYYFDSMVNGGTYIVNTTTSGSLVPMSLKGLFKATGMTDFSSCYSSYVNQLNERIELYNKGEITEEQLKAPIATRYSRIGTPETTIVFVPMADTLITYGELLNGITSRNEVTGGTGASTTRFITESTLYNKLAPTARDNTTLASSLLKVANEHRNSGRLQNIVPLTFFPDSALSTENVPTTGNADSISGKNTLYASAYLRSRSLDKSTINYLGSFGAVTDASNMALYSRDSNNNILVDFMGATTHMFSRAKELIKDAYKGIRANSKSKAINDNVTHGYREGIEGTVEDAIKSHVFKKMDSTNINNMIDRAIAMDSKRGINSTWLKEEYGEMLVNSMRPLMFGLDSGSDKSWSGKLNGVTYAHVSSVGTDSVTEKLFHEALIHTVMEAVDKNNTLQRQASQMYQYVMRNVSVDDFDCSKEEATEILDYINSRGGKESLGEFYAYAMTSTAFRSAIAKIPSKKETVDSMFARIKSITARVFRSIYSKGVPITAELPIDSLREIFASAYNTFNAMEEEALNHDLMTDVEKIKGIGTIDLKISKLLENALSTINLPLGAMQRVTQTEEMMQTIQQIKGENPGVSNTPADRILNVVDDMVTKMNTTTNLKKELAVHLSEILNSLHGDSTKNWDYIKHRLAAKQAVDVARESASKSVNDVVKKLTKDLPPKVRNQLTHYLIRTDVSALYNYPNTIKNTDIKDILTNPKIRKAKIDELEGVLRSNQLGNYYINAAKGLSSYMNTGINTTGLGYRNAWEIVALSGSTRTNPNPPQSLVADIDLLTTLYNIDYMDTKDTSIYKDIPMEVIDQLSAIHNKIKETEFNTVYGNSAQKYHIPKGELHGGNSKGTVVIYTKDNQKALEWAASYGTTITDTKLDPFYKAQGLDCITAVYPHRSPIPVESGMFALTDTFKGRIMPNNRIDSRVAENTIFNAKKVQEYLSKRITNLNSATPKLIDPETVDGNFIPSFDSTGALVGSNFELNPIVAANKTGRHYKINSVLGDIYGSVIERTQAPITNKESAQALIDIYESNKNNPDKEFVWISPLSTESVYREYYNMLPEEAKSVFYKQYKDKGAPVLKGNIPLITGKRQTSSKHIDTTYYELKDMGLLKWQDKMTHIFRNGWVSLGEDVATTLTKLGKDNIVVKSLTVSINNYKSNFLSLVMRGLSPAQAVEFILEGVDQERQLEAYNDKLNSYKGIQMTRALTQGELRDYKATENSLKSLPIYPLFEAGGLGTIADDLSNIDRPVKDFIDTYFPNSLRGIAQEVALTPESKVYGLLRDFCSIGDKAGKYALYKYLPAKMSFDEKLRILQETFIDYSIPLPTGLDYMEAVGIASFMKYGLGIQKTILNTLVNKPSRSLATVLAAKSLSNITHTPTIMDSFLSIGSLGQGPRVPGIELFLNSMSETPYGKLLSSI